MRVPQVSERIKEAPAQALRGVFAGIGQLLLITDKLKNKTPATKDTPRARAPKASPQAAVTRPAGQRGQTAAATAEPVASALAAAEAAAPIEAVAAEPAVAKPAPAKPAPAKPAPAKPATVKPATVKPATAKPAPAKPAPAKPAPAKPAIAKPAKVRRAAVRPTGPAGAEPPKPPKRQSPRDFDKTGNVRLLGDEGGGSALSATAPATAAEPVGAAEAAGWLTDSGPPLPNYDELSVASLRARLRNLDVAKVRQLADYERAHAARADVVTMFERRITKLETEL